MRRLALLFALAASACQGRQLTHRERELLAAAREQERADLFEVRKDSIFDLSQRSDLNPPAAYLDRAEFEYRR